MTNKSITEKPSETALMAALRRDLAHKEYKNDKFGPDHLAGIFLPAYFRFFLKFKRIQQNTIARLNEALPGLNEYMIARTAYFDQLFREALKQKTSQIVLLGAGYDTRAYRFAKLNHASKIYELDAAPTQNRKLECLKKARIEIPEIVNFVSIDFNTQSSKDTLLSAGYQNDQKTLFIWEGVSYYLEPESVDQTLEFVCENSHPESSLALDYTISVTDDNIDAFYGVREFIHTMQEHHGSEVLLFSIPEGKIKSFLESRGFRLVEHLDNQQIEERYLTDENEQLIGHMTGHFRFATASPTD